MEKPLELNNNSHSNSLTVLVDFHLLHIQQTDNLRSCSLPFRKNCNSHGHRVNVGSQNMNLHLQSVPLENLSSVWYPLEEMDHQKQTE